MDEQGRNIGGLPYPVYYPSVSSVAKNVWGVADHVELLVAANFPQFLVSCFDVDKLKNDARLKESLRKAEEQSQIVLYDSGVYEVVWSRSKRWNRKKYLHTLNCNRVTHAFCLDDYIVNRKAADPELLVADIHRTSGVVGDDLVSPIIHCGSTDEYVETCVRVSELAKPRLLAMPERELGRGLVEVASTISKIRIELNKLGGYQPIHILGTGNPLSMMVYAFAGADSFDGLDWCQTVADYESATLHHTWHYDLYAHQGAWGGEVDMSMLTRCFLHNLDFYNIWMDKIRVACGTEKIFDMVDEYINGPQKVVILDLLHNNQNSTGDHRETVANR